MSGKNGDKGRRPVSGAEGVERTATGGRWSSDPRAKPAMELMVWVGLCRSCRVNILVQSTNKLRLA